MKPRDLPTLVLLPLLSLVGCGGGDEPAPTTQAPPPVARMPKPNRALERPAINAQPRERPQPASEPLGWNPAREPLAKVGAFAVDPEPGFAIDDLATPPRQTEPVTVVPPPEGYDREAFAMARPNVTRATQPPPSGFRADSTEGGAGGYPKAIVHEQTGHRLALIEGGTFTRGSDDDPTARPPHPVRVSPFYLSEAEVTVGEYEPYVRQTDGAREPVNAGASDEPAVGLMWRDASGWTRWAGGRLPTEAEWELAARTTRSLDNVWGNGRPIFRTDRQAGEVRTVRSEPEDRTRDGVYDLAGNAREWTEDQFDERSYEKAAEDAPLVDPIGTARRGTRRVVRGQPDGFSVTHREGLSMATQDPTIGFRMAVPIAGE